MADFPVRFHSDALEEAEKSKNWYAERSPVAALGFVNDLSHAVRMISEAPFRWPMSHKGTRRYIFPRYPFSVIYRVKEEMVEVLNKLPINPDQWKEEIKNVGQWLGRLLGPLADLSDIASDYLRYYRVKKLLELKEKLKFELRKRGYSDIPGSIEVSFGVPLIEAAILEENEDLQQLWANLLANALDPKIKEKPKKVFIDILKQMEGFDAQLMKDLYSATIKSGNRYIFTTFYPNSLESSNEESSEGFETKPSYEVCISIEILIRLGLLTTAGTFEGSHYHQRVQLSRLGLSFMNSVLGA